MLDYGYVSNRLYVGLWREYQIGYMLDYGGREYRWLFVDYRGSTK
jgi:hypothetical protein